MPLVIQSNRFTKCHLIVPSRLAYEAFLFLHLIDLRILANL
jgi:hypothetical protein